MCISCFLILFLAFLCWTLWSSWWLRTGQRRPWQLKFYFVRYFHDIRLRSVGTRWWNWRALLFLQLQLLLYDKLSTLILESSLCMFFFFCGCQFHIRSLQSLGKFQEKKQVIKKKKITFSFCGSLYEQSRVLWGSNRLKIQTKVQNATNPWEINRSLSVVHFFMMDDNSSSTFWKTHTKNEFLLVSFSRVTH